MDAMVMAPSKAAQPQRASLASSLMGWERWELKIAVPWYKWKDSFWEGEVDQGWGEEM